MPIQGPLSAQSQVANPNVDLDAPPPLPPGTTRRPTLQQLGGAESLGQEESNPAIQALKALKMIEMGAQMLGGAFPGLAPELAELVGGLRQAVPQRLAQMQQGEGGGGPQMSLPPQAM